MTLDHKTSLKGVVHPKNVILSSFTQLSSFTPSSSSKPVWMSLFCRTQRKIFWRMWETEQFWGTIDLHSIFFSYYGSQWCPKTAWLQTFFKISSFVFGRTKTFIQVWNYLRVSKWWQNFHFWVNYPFKSLGYICSNSQNYIVWVKIIDFSFMQKIIRILSKDHVPWRYFVNFLL